MTLSAAFSHVNIPNEWKGLTRASGRGVVERQIPIDPKADPGPRGVPSLAAFGRRPSVLLATLRSAGIRNPSHEPTSSSKLDNLTGEPTPRRPKRRSRAQWESRVKCELLHTGRPPSSDILALCRTAPYGESRLNLGSLDASVRAIAGRRSRVERLVAPLPGRKGLSRGLHGEHDGCCGTGI
jgi:hypothetical protein